MCAVPRTNKAVVFGRFHKTLRICNLRKNEDSRS
jgi:hypothetical protein